MAVICDRQLAPELPELADPDMALQQSGALRGRRAQSACRWPRCSSAIAERLPTLLQIFATSQHLSDLLIRDPEAF